MYPHYNDKVSLADTSNPVFVSTTVTSKQSIGNIYLPVAIKGIEFAWIKGK